MAEEIDEYTKIITAEINDYKTKTADELNELKQKLRDHTNLKKTISLQINQINRRIGKINSKEKIYYRKLSKCINTVNIMKLYNKHKILVIDAGCITHNLRASCAMLGLTKTINGYVFKRYNTKGVYNKCKVHLNMVDFTIQMIDNKLQFPESELNTKIYNFLVDVKASFMDFSLSNDPICEIDKLSPDILLHHNFINELTNKSNDVYIDIPIVTNFRSYNRVHLEYGETSNIIAKLVIITLVVEPTKSKKHTVVV